MTAPMLWRRPERDARRTLELAAKRTCELAVATCLLVLLSPVLLVIAALIGVESRGPVLFRQVRVGRYGQPFLICKFRTMVRGADRLGVNISPRYDPRITVVGRFLRRTYLDELPQLFNILTGDMALVGPRPETPEFVALYQPAELRVLSVRPGVMGPSTLAGMDEEDRLAQACDPLRLYLSKILPERVCADLSYLENWSISRDVRLVVAQVHAILRRLS